MLGHDSFVASGKCRSVQQFPLSHHGLREEHLGDVELAARLGQHLPPSHEGLFQQATASVIKQVEQHVLRPLGASE